MFGVMLTVILAQQMLGNHGCVRVASLTVALIMKI